MAPVIRGSAICRFLFPQKSANCKDFIYFYKFHICVASFLHVFMYWRNMEFIACFETKWLPQNSHLNGFILSWIEVTCWFSFCFEVKQLPKSLQLNSSLPLWAHLKWIFRSPIITNFTFKWLFPFMDWHFIVLDPFFKNSYIHKFHICMASFFHVLQKCRLKWEFFISH